ncbi:ABC transporter permease [Paenisporosarcina sp. FSL H8-0542]|uniref:ABC transporter permease n=1 Tax=Paenisporosarcina sp. FSL H8-0542 TaxID=2921401 RepID=UPI00315A4584
MKFELIFTEVFWKSVKRGGKCIFEQQFYHKVAKSSAKFLIFTIIIILFFTGITFTFVIPGLKGFSLYFMIVSLLIYFVVANIFVGLSKERIWFVFIGSLILSSLGMGWRLWLEWGEYSLVEHMNPVVYVGYPSIIAFIITAIYSFSSSYLERKLNEKKRSVF